MLNILSASAKKAKSPKVDSSYNKKFMLAWLNLELITQEENLSFTKSLIENQSN